MTKAAGMSVLVFVINFICKNPCIITSSQMPLRNCTIVFCFYFDVTYQSGICFNFKVFGEGSVCIRHCCWFCCPQGCKIPGGTCNQKLNLGGHPNPAFYVLQKSCTNFTYLVLFSQVDDCNQILTVKTLPLSGAKIIASTNAVN